MPDITEFNAGDLQLRPSQSGVEANVRSAYRLGAFGRQQAQALDQSGRAIGGGIAAAGQMALQQEDHREISDGMKTGAQLLFEKTQEANKVLNDPNLNVLKNPGAGRQWLDQSLEPALDDFQSQFHTERSQEWATRYADQVREGLSRTVAADISTRSGTQVHNNLILSADTFASAVYNDPSHLGLALEGFNHGLDGAIGSSPGLSAEKGAEIRGDLGVAGPKQIVSAAIHGVIAKGGDWHSIADDPKYAPYVNADELGQFVRAQRVQERVGLASQKQAELQQKQIDSLNVDKAAAAAMNQWVSSDPRTGQVMIDPRFFTDTLDIARKYPDAPNTAETVRTAISWGQTRQSERKIVSDPATLSALTSGLFDPDHPTTEIDLMRAQVAHKLSNEDFQPMQQLVKTLQDSPLKGPVWKETMDAVKNYYLNRGTKDDPDGSLAFARFTQTFVPTYLAEFRAGKLPPNATDMNDPQSLIRRAMAPFGGSLTDALHRLGAGQPAFAPPQNWMFNPKRQQYRDPSGKLYNVDGQPVK